MPVSSCLVIMIISATSTIFIFHLCTYVQISQNNKYLIGNLRNKVPRSYYFPSNIALFLYTKSRTFVWSVRAKTDTGSGYCERYIIDRERLSSLHGSRVWEPLGKKDTPRATYNDVAFFKSTPRKSLRVIISFAFEICIITQHKYVLCNAQRELPNIIIIRNVLTYAQPEFPF